MKMKIQIDQIQELTKQKMENNEYIKVQDRLVAEQDAKIKELDRLLKSQKEKTDELSTLLESKKREVEKSKKEVE
jgi:hypothetical protein